VLSSAGVDGAIDIVSAFGSDDYWAFWIGEWLERYRLQARVGYYLGIEDVYRHDARIWAALSPEADLSTVVAIEHAIFRIIHDEAFRAAISEIQGGPREIPHAFYLSGNTWFFRYDGKELPFPADIDLARLQAVMRGSPSHVPWHELAQLDKSGRKVSEKGTNCTQTAVPNELVLIKRVVDLEEHVAKARALGSFDAAEKEEDLASARAELPGVWRDASTSTLEAELAKVSQVDTRHSQSAPDDDVQPESVRRSLQRARKMLLEKFPELKGSFEGAFEAKSYGCAYKPSAMIHWNFEPLER
jgi:hypothetical protein